MALQSNIIYTANQTQAFDTVPSCDVSEFDYKNIVNADDITKFQFKLFPHKNVPELATNAELNAGTSGSATITSWTNSGFYYYSLIGGFITNNDVSYAQIQQTLNLASGAMIEVTVGVQTNTSGFRVALGTDSKVVDRNVTGDIKFYYVASSNNPDVIVTYLPQAIYASVNALQISYIRIKEVSLNYRFIIRNINTGYTEYSLKLTDYVNGTNPTGAEPFRRIDNYLTFSHDWTGLTNGCYKIELADGYLNTNLQNGIGNESFLVDDIDATGSSTEWDGFAISINSVNIVTGQLVIDLQAGVSGWGMYTRKATKVGVTYNVILSATANGAQTYTFGYGNLGSLASTVLTNGDDFSGSFVGDGNPFGMTFTNPSGATVLKIDSLILEVADENELIGNYFSNDFILTNSSCDTIEISACNDVDSFGFSFPLSNFSLNARFNGKVTLPQYPTDRDAFINNAGNTRTTFFQRQKTKVIKLDLVPEYMLDFLTLLGGMDHIYINDKEYSADKDEFINILAENSLDTFAKVVLFLFEKDTTAINKVTTSLGAGCGAEIEYLVDPEDVSDPNDDTLIIDPQTGDGIISLE